METEEEAQRILEELQGTLDPDKQSAGPSAPAPGMPQMCPGCANCTDLGLLVNAAC